MGYVSNRRNGNGENKKQEERSKRQERAQRILDAAAELIQRWGYNKTTIDDIARQAGVAKGTIYLHWKTREDLFEALIKREELVVAEDIQRRIVNDPEGATLHGLMKHSMLATMKNPLMKAVILREGDVLGELTHKEYSTRAYEERIASFKRFFEFLRSHDLVRNDIGMREQIYILNAVSMGVLLADPWLPDEFKVSDEEAVELMAETIKRTLEPRNTATGGELQEVTIVFNQYIDYIVESTKEQVQKEMES
jgi:AcrR family transcriptional regulator